MTINHNPGCRYHQLADTCHNNADGGVASPSGLTPFPGYRFAPQPGAPRQDVFGQHKHQLQPTNDAQIAMMQRQIDALNQQLQQAKAVLSAAQAPVACPACAPPAPCPNCPPPPQCPDCPPQQSCPACPACGNPVFVTVPTPMTSDTRTVADAGSTATYEPSQPRPPRGVMGETADVSPAGDPGMFSAAALPFGGGGFGQESRPVAAPVTGDYSANPAPGAQDYKPVGGMTSALAPQGSARLAEAPIVPVYRPNENAIAQIEAQPPAQPTSSIRGLCSSCKAPVAVAVPTNAKAGCMVGYSCPSCGKASVAAVGGAQPSPTNKYFKDMRVKRLVKQFKNKKITYDQLRTALQRNFGMTTVEIDAAVAGRS